MVTPSTPGPPLFSLTFLNAPTTACLGIANGFLSTSADSPSSSRPTPVDPKPTMDEPSPWLHPHYRGIIATTRRSASRRGNGTQPLAVSAAWRAPYRPGQPDRDLSASAFQRSLQEPQIRFTPPICRTPPGQYMGTRQTPSRVLEPNAG